MADPWCAIQNVADIESPALAVYPERIEANIRRLLELAGGPQRVRPHLKTHKMAEIVRMHLAMGVTKFKAATLAEVEMAARAGAADVLLAFPLVGPAAVRFARVVAEHPSVKLSAIFDDAQALRHVSAVLSAAGLRCAMLLDLDIGMGRTGAAPNDRAIELYRLLAELPGVELGGLHAYDGHIHDADPAVRRRETAAAFAQVEALAQQLAQAGLDVPRIVAGGSPTFGEHAQDARRECSPGTYVFWDSNYGPNYPELGFLPAAVLAARVISKPRSGRLCIDLGYKALSADQPHPRVQLLSLPDARTVLHNEEHLTIETARADEHQVGDVLYGVPRHICPTVALHREAIVVRDGRAVERWQVTARDRVL